MSKNLSLIMLIFFLSLFLSYHLYNYSINKINEIKVEEYVERIESFPQDTVEKENIPDNNDYLGIILIPKINVKNFFYNFDDSKNNVNQNVQLLSNSEMPDVKGSSILLAAHSGNSYLGYFKNLYKLTLGDKIIIYYQNKPYEYYVNEIYEQEKDGNITYHKNSNDNLLILTTCSGKDKQLIITAKLKINE